MRLHFGYVSIVIALGAFPQLSHSEETRYGCVQIDVMAAGTDLEPWDSWQSWCELSQDQPNSMCFDWIDESWVERQSFELEHILDFMEAGERTCPSVPDGAPPIIRGE